MDFIINEIIPFVKNHPILTLAWIGLFVVIIYLTIKEKFSKVKSLANGQAIEMINKQDAVVVDIRPADNFKKGHIAQSINVLPIDIKNGSVKAIEKYKESPIILVDHNNIPMASSAAAANLEKQGFTQVYILKDGIAGWNDGNLPLVRK